MQVEVISGRFVGMKGELVKDNGWDRWSTVYVRGDCVIFVNKTNLRNIEV